MYQFVDFTSGVEAYEVLCLKIVQQLKQAIADKGRACLCVSGGKSPIPLFQALSVMDLAWEKITLLLVDERLVDPENAMSNTRLVKEYLLINQASKMQFIQWIDTIPHDTGPILPDSARARMAFQRANENYMPPTVTLLGMGDDGHTASLFPMGMPFEPAETPYILSEAPVNTRHRLTLTFEALLQSQFLYLPLIDANKYDVLRKSIVSQSHTYPISVLLHHENEPSVQIYTVNLNTGMSKAC
ncbi:MAG: 6-phosphogluconolactonase [Neisseriaceae bacterium]|nr:6-phosphogluconolactonase [Neisseriaceae bacterium]